MTPTLTCGDDGLCAAYGLLVEAKGEKFDGGIIEERRDRGFNKKSVTDLMKRIDDEANNHAGGR